MSRVLDTDSRERPVRRSIDAQARSPARSDAFARPLLLVATGVSVALLVTVAVSLSRSSGLVAGLWGAGGLAVAVWLRSGRGAAHDLTFGSVVAFSVLFGELLAGNSFELSLMFTAASTIEIAAAVFLARWFAPTLNMSNLSGASRFLFFAAVLAPIPAGLLAAGALTGMEGDPFWEGFQTWWFGHALGIAVIGALGLSLTRASVLRLMELRRLAEAALLLGAILGFYYIGFTGAMTMGFVMVPLLLTIAVRLGVAGTAIALLAVTLLSVGGAVAGYGPYREGLDHGQQVLMAQLLVLVAYVPILIVAALLEERDRLAERSRLGRERAERASEAKSRLLANVAHEIKSPVAGVIGIGDLWSKGQLGPVTPQQTEMAEMLVKTARQVEALALDLLDVARAEAGAVRVDLRPTDVPGLLEDLRRGVVLRPEAKSVAVEVVCDGDGLVAVADSQRLAQVVDNLVSNALKYAASGGRVILRAGHEDDCVRVEVIDFGPGLTDQKQAQLFEPFNRLGLERSSIEGHGVGLALAKRLIELQGGVIGVTSEPGQGATFWIRLPRA